MNKLNRLVNVLAVGMALTFPVAVYFGLQFADPRSLGLLLLAMLLLRHGRSARRFASHIGLAEWAILAGLGGLTGAIIVCNSEPLLLLYPAAVSLAMLLLFGRTLLYPPSLVERIARLAEPDLPPAGVRYTRRVTIAWCVFFVVNGSVAASTVFFSREWWLLYNGLIAYLAMGLMFAGEWLLRGRLRRGAA